jgi:hypothetical protein
MNEQGRAGREPSGFAHNHSIDSKGVSMKKHLIIAAAVAAVLVPTATAASSSLRVIGSGRAAGSFAIASASGSKHNMRAAYLRAYGSRLSTFAVVACSRGYSVGSNTKRFSSMRSGQLYRLRLPMGGGDCDVTASLSGRGRIKLQILAS